MCILKIHADSHTANAIQSAAHNMDTSVSDLDTLQRLLEQRGHTLEAQNVRDVLASLSGLTSQVWDTWDEFVHESPAVDTAPIGEEEVRHSDMYASTFSHKG